MLSPVKNTPNKDQPVAALDLGGGGWTSPHTVRVLSGSALVLGEAVWWAAQAPLAGDLPGVSPGKASLNAHLCGAET